MCLQSAQGLDASPNVRREEGPLLLSHFDQVLDGLAYEFFNECSEFRVIGRLVGNRNDITESCQEPDIDRSFEFQCFLEISEGLMVLFRQISVKLQRACPSPPALHQDREVYATPAAVFLDGFLDVFFTRTHGLRQSQAGFQKPVIDRSNFHRHLSVLPGPLSSSESGHAGDHCGSFPFQ